MDAPAFTLLDTEAPQTECGLNFEVSIPPFSMEVVSHLEAVLAEIALNGVLVEMNNSSVLLCLMSLVLPIYNMQALTGQMLDMFSGAEYILTGNNGPDL